MELENYKKMSKNVIRLDGKFWHFYIRSRVSESEPNITGKYLFFSEDKKELEKIAVEELENNGFFRAKINTDNHKKGSEYVLCLYYSDDSRKVDLLQKYRNNSKIKYRHWKSDEATLKGKYSKQFLDKLPQKERKQWTKAKI